MALTLFEDTFLVDASSYLTGKPLWDAATTAEQEEALKDATVMLNERDWLGSASSTSQSLAWGREKLTFFDPVLALEVTAEKDTVPIRLEKAVSAQALHLLTYPTISARYSETFDRIKLGPLEIENTDSGSTRPIPPVPLSVENLIAPLTLSGSGTNAISAGAWWRAN